MVSADVPHADVVAHDDDDVGPLSRRCGLRLRLPHRDRRACAERRGCRERRAAEQNATAIECVFLGLGLVSMLLRTHEPSLSLMTHRNPTWLVDVSTGSAWRAAER